ncbi:hypothetical protein AGMMS50262_23920 [Bacteroidia bacterium]|nr:hypothetical protein AGMMS50262_23920 [Bacteroidia bacterium]
MKRFKLIVFFLFLANITSAQNQITCSVYTGAGSGTNLGGIFGVGCEIKYKFVSVNVATGYPFHVSNKIGFVSRFDYDTGVKIYAPFGAFAGINYGYLTSPSYNNESKSITRFHGLSYSIGYRHTIFKKIYGLAYVGIAPNKRKEDKNAWFVNTKNDYLPKFGLLLGYEF